MLYPSLTWDRNAGETGAAGISAPPSTPMVFGPAGRAILGAALFLGLAGLPMAGSVVLPAGLTGHATPIAAALVADDGAEAPYPYAGESRGMGQGTQAALGEDEEELQTMQNEVIMQEGSGPATRSVAKPKKVILPNDAAAPVAATQAFSHAFAEWQAKDMSAAVAALDQAIATDPDYGRAYYLRGYIEMESGDDAKAEQDLTTAVRDNGGLGEAYLALGYLDFKAQQFPGAQQDYQRALALLQGDWHPDFGLSVVDLHMADYSEALNFALKAAGAKGPPECYYVAARAYDGEGDKSKAIAEYSKYLGDHPQKPEAEARANQRLAELTKRP